MVFLPSTFNRMWSNVSAGSHYAHGSSQPRANSSLITFNSSAQWLTHFNSSKDTSKLMVIDFTATWCSPCRLMEPFLKELASKYPNVEFIKIDVDKLMNVAQQFGVEAMPTIVLIKNGKVVDMVVGVKQWELQQKIGEHSTDYNAWSLQ